MSTIVGTNIEVTNIKFDSDTTAMIVSSSGGGAGTVPQGLIKAYVCYSTSSGTAIHGSESFNHSSLTDITTGATKFTMTSAMSTSKFSLSDCGGVFREKTQEDKLPE